MNNLTWFVDDDVKWPSKDDKNWLPDNQKMLPMWPESATRWERVKRIGKRRPYMFQRPWIFYSPHLKAWGLIPENFVHDWASLPRPAQAITSSDGIFAAGAVGHDFGYRFHGMLLAKWYKGPFFFTPMTRLELDIFFREQNTWSNGLPIANQAAFLALDTFGGFNFQPRLIECEDWSKPVYSNTGM